LALDAIAQDPLSIWLAMQNLTRSSNLTYFFSLKYQSSGPMQHYVQHNATISVYLGPHECSCQFRFFIVLAGCLSVTDAQTTLPRNSRTALLMLPCCLIRTDIIPALSVYLFNITKKSA